VLEILDLELFGVKILVSILIESSLATFVLLGVKNFFLNLALFLLGQKWVFEISLDSCLKIF
jgi:hypothetical protein